MLQFMIRYRLWLTTQFNNSTEQKNIFSYFQISALQKRIGSIIENAGKSGVNIVCLQEAWSTSSETMKFSFFSINYFQQCPLPSVQEKNIHGLSLLNLLRLVPQLCFCLRWHLLDRYLTLILESISNNFWMIFSVSSSLSDGNYISNIGTWRGPWWHALEHGRGDWPHGEGHWEDQEEPYSPCWRLQWVYILSWGKCEYKIQVALASWFMLNL